MEGWIPAKFSVDKALFIYASLDVWPFFFSKCPIRPHMAFDAHCIRGRTAETSEFLASAEVKTCEHDGWPDGEDPLPSSSRILSDKGHHSEVPPR